MRAVREALGQLLEYAFDCKSNEERVGRLLVAAPGEPRERDRSYMEHTGRKKIRLAAVSRLSNISV